MFEELLTGKMAGVENGVPAPYGGHMATDEDDVKPIDLETVMDPLGKVIPISQKVFVSLAEFLF